MGTEGWTREWPREPGLYWFYGWTCKWSRDQNLDPRMSLVNVHTITNGIMYHTDGQFMYPAEGGIGFWQRADVPAPPTDIFETFYRMVEDLKTRLKDVKSYGVKVHFNGDIDNPRIFCSTTSIRGSAHPRRR